LKQTLNAMKTIEMARMARSRASGMSARSNTGAKKKSPRYGEMVMP